MIEPVDLAWARHGDPVQDDAGHPVGVTFGVGQDQRRCPRSAVEQPSIDSQLLTERLHVIEQAFGGVVCHVGCGIGCAGHDLTAPALIERHDSEHVEIEHLVRTARSTAYRATVNDQNPPATRIAASLPRHPVTVTNIEQPRS